MSNNESYETFSLKRLSDLVRFVQQKLDPNDRTIFRGQKRDWALLPKIARLKDVDVFAAEREMFNEFKRRSVGYVDLPPDNDWDYLALAQHHGLPTRLLDWTTNPLAAAWFCVTEPVLPPDGCGVIWSYVPDLPDFMSRSEMRRSPFKTERTAIFESQLISPRIRAQEGVFTIHAPQKRPKAFVAYEEKGTHVPCMKKLLIAHRDFARFRQDLHSHGVKPSSLFPDLDGLAQTISEENSYLGDESSAF